MVLVNTDGNSVIHVAFKSEKVLRKGKTIEGLLLRAGNLILSLVQRIGRVMHLVKTFFEVIQRKAEVERTFGVFEVFGAIFVLLSQVDFRRGHAGHTENSATRNQYDNRLQLVTLGYDYIYDLVGLVFIRLIVRFGIWVRFWVGKRVSTKLGKSSHLG